MSFGGIKSQQIFLKPHVHSCPYVQLQNTTINIKEGRRAGGKKRKLLTEKMIMQKSFFASSSEFDATTYCRMSMREMP
jgi:hypothetical protein